MPLADSAPYANVPSLAILVSLGTIDRPPLDASRVKAAADLSTFRRMTSRSSVAVSPIRTGIDVIGGAGTFPNVLPGIKRNFKRIVFRRDSLPILLDRKRTRPKPSYRQ